jgi:hypothetical protein
MAETRELCRRHLTSDMIDQQHISNSWLEAGPSVTTIIRHRLILPCQHITGRLDAYMGRRADDEHLPSPESALAKDIDQCQTACQISTVL